MVVEINGVAVEFDEKLIIKQEIKVGDPVQLLKKDYSDYKLYKGVVTQILPFSDKPVVEVMYIEEGYSSFSIKTAVIADGQDSGIKIVRVDNEFLPFTKDRDIDNRFLYFVLKEKQEELMQSKQGAGIPDINRTTINKLFNDASTQGYGSVLAASFIALIPAVIIFCIVQRYIKDGIALTGVK